MLELTYMIQQLKYSVTNFRDNVAREEQPKDS